MREPVAPIAAIKTTMHASPTKIPSLRTTVDRDSIFMVIAATNGTAQ